MEIWCTTVNEIAGSGYAKAFGHTPLKFEIDAYEHDAFRGQLSGLAVGLMGCHEVFERYDVSRPLPPRLAGRGRLR